MELNEIKNLIKIDGGKFIIIENGEPVLMIMGFEDYKKIIGNSEDKSEEVREITKQPQEFNSENNNEYTKTNETIPQSEESLKIEDLPV